MKILFISHYFWPEGNAPATRVYEMTRRWVKAGHQVTVVTGVPNVPNGVVYEGYRNGWKQVGTVDGVTCVRVWTYLAANRGTLRRILNYVSFMFTAILAGLRVERPDMVIATSPQFFCGWAGAWVARLRRRPFVLEIRDLWPESIVAVGAIRNLHVIRFLEWLERRLYRTARHIVTVGDGYRRELKAHGVEDERISVIPNGVDIELFNETVSGRAIREGLELQAKFVCSYIGTIGMACGLSIVLRAASLLKKRHRADICFLLVGDGAVRQDLEAEARAQNLNNIIFTGRVSKDRIPEYLAASDACLIHLRRENLFRTVMPSKIFEAAAMGKAMILGVEGDAARLVAQAGAGIFISPEDDEALVRALERMAANLGWVNTLGEAGRENIVPSHNYDHLAATYLDLLGQLAI